MIEIKGDVQHSLPVGDDGTSQSQTDGSVRVYYLVHPAVDTEGESSIA